MEDFILTSDERAALKAVMSRYQPCSDGEHIRRKHDETYVGWYGQHTYSFEPKHPGILCGRGESTATREPMEWEFKPPPRLWHVRGEFIARLILCANNGFGNGALGRIKRIAPNKQKNLHILWPTPKLLHGNDLHLKNLSVSGDIILDNIKPKKGVFALSLNFDQVFMDRLIAKKSIFGNVTFKDCRAQSVMLPRCKFTSLTFKRSPETALRTAKRKIIKSILQLQKERRERLNGQRSDFSKDMHMPFTRGAHGKGDFGLIMAPDIQVQHDVRFEGVRVTGLPQDAPDTALAAKYMENVKPKQNATPLPSLVLDGAVIKGDLSFVDSSGLDADEREILYRSSAQMNTPAAREKLRTIGGSLQLPCIVMGGTNLRNIKVRNTLHIMHAWFIAQSKHRKFTDWIGTEDARIFDDMMASAPNRESIALDLDNARMGALVVCETAYAVHTAATDYAIKDGIFKPDADNPKSFHDAKLALSYTMMARSLFCGSINLENARLKRALFLGAWVNGTVLLSDALIAEEIRFAANVWTCRIGAFDLGGKVCAHNRRVSGSVLIFSGCVTGPNTDDVNSVKFDKAYPPHPDWRISYETPKQEKAGTPRHPDPCLVDGLRYESALGKWNGTITTHPLLQNPQTHPPLKTLIVIKEL